MTLAVLLALALAQEAPQCSISGRVYNAATQAPLARASVHLGGRTVPDRDSGPATVTDAGGNFHFDKLAAGEYIAQVHLRSAADGRYTQFTLDEGTQQSAVETAIAKLP